MLFITSEYGKMERLKPLVILFFCIRWSIQFDVGGFFYASFKPSIFSGQDLSIAVLERMKERIYH